jgi:hypothetical protein
MKQRPTVKPSNRVCPIELGVEVRHQFVRRLKLESFRGHRFVPRINRLDDGTHCPPEADHAVRWRLEIQPGALVILISAASN